MANVIRDYVDPVQIGHVLEVVVWKGDVQQYSAAGRLLFFAVCDENYALQFEGGEYAVIRWTNDCTFTISYDPERVQ